MLLSNMYTEYKMEHNSDTLQAAGNFHKVLKPWCTAFLLPLRLSLFYCAFSLSIVYLVTRVSFLEKNMRC